MKSWHLENGGNTLISSQRGFTALGSTGGILPRVGGEAGQEQHEKSQQSWSTPSLCPAPEGLCFRAHKESLHCTASKDRMLRGAWNTLSKKGSTPGFALP